MIRAQIAAGMAGVFFLSALCGSGQQPDSSPTAQTVPRVVKFTGVLSDVAGKPLNGPADVTFSLYKEQSGGEPLWWETQTLEADAQGRYTVLLGATRPEGLPVEVFASGEARWLAVLVGKEPEQTRVLLVSVPYALKAEEAEKLGGKRASDFVLAEKLKEEVKTAVAVEVQQVGEKTSEQAAEKGPQPLTGAEGPTDFTGSNSTQIVSVTQSSTGLGLKSTSSSNSALYGVIQAGATAAAAVRGETNGTTGMGVFGYATATTGTTTGVRGQSDSPNGVGVRGVSATTGYNYAVYGLARSTQGRGVLAQATATSGPTVGVLGMVSSPGGVWFGTNSTVSFPALSFIATSTGAYLTTGGTWTNASDRNLKANFASVDGRTLLAKLDAMPVSTWNYKAEDASVRHLGPTAQDFRAAFGLGADDQHITTVDEGGVALAAVQALYRLTQSKDKRIEALTKEVDELRARLARLEQALAKK